MAVAGFGPFGDNMNKWQIICPLAALVVVFVILGLPGSRDYQYFITVRTREIGRDLISATNSSHLAEIAPALQMSLSRLLSSPTYVANALFGDEPPPVGDGRACSRLVLTNDLGDGIVLRLQQGTNFETFHVLSYWDVTEQGGADSSHRAGQ